MQTKQLSFIFKTMKFKHSSHLKMSRPIESNFGSVYSMLNRHVQKCHVKMSSLANLFVPLNLVARSELDKFNSKTAQRVKYHSGINQLFAILYKILS